MKWQGRARSSNVEDHRASTGGVGGGMGGFGGGLSPFGRGGRIPIRVGRGGGVGGIVAIVVLLGIVWAVTGQNPLQVLSGGGGSMEPSQSVQSEPLQPGDDPANFVAVVLKETETLWTQVFEQNNLTYQPPKLVLYDQADPSSGCGVAQAASGPFYCPLDKKIYIDLSFYDQLRSQFGAPGDFAQAYVVAHEVGHAVQDQLGVLGVFDQKRQQMSEAEGNAYSVKVELQADCYAGVWANFAGQENILESGDTQEALTAARQIGDDTLTRGQVAPRNYTHGTSAQRQYWLKRGMDSGDVGQCDTFAPGAVS
jgi:predicted metalloprotease